MPIWGWVCVGLTLAAVAAAAWVAFSIWQFGRQQDRLMRDGQSVVARIFLANPSLYDAERPMAFEGAFVVFTLDNDASEQHLAFLKGISDRLESFTPEEDDAGEKKIAWALDTQRTIGTVLRVPDRVTGGREVYFATPSVFRRMLPEGKLTRDYICLKVLIDGTYRDAAMIEYPDAPASSQ